MLESLKAYSSNINRIALAFHYSPNYVFLENENIFGENNKQFLINLIKNNNIQRMDFLACNTLRDMEWKTFYDSIVSETNVILGASDNESGNIQYGGDWIMENTSEDIQSVYFNDNIVYYKYLLDFAFAYMSFVNNNSLYFVGDNGHGQSGNGGEINIGGPDTFPKKIYNGTGKIIADMKSVGVSTLYLMTDGTIYGVGGTNGGDNRFQGNLGLPISVTSPYLHLLENLIQVTLPAGKIASKIFRCRFNGTSFAIMTDGTLYGAGPNLSGQLGLGDTTPRYTFTNIPLPTGKTPSQLATGSDFFAALMTDGTVYAVGANGSGQLGTGDNTNRTTLTQITLPSGKTPLDIKAGGAFLIILMTDGTIYGTGQNNSGGLGLGNTTNVNTLTLMLNSTGKTPSQISCGGYSSMVLMTDGTIYGTGRNSEGQLGIGNTSNKSSLTQMILPTGKTALKLFTADNVDYPESTIVMMTDNTIYATGSNDKGQLGNGTTSAVSTSILTEMTAIPNKTWSKIVSQGSTSLFLDNNGIVYVCGESVNGGFNYVGIGRNIFQNVRHPTRGITLSELVSNTTGKTVSKLLRGGQHQMVLMSDNTLYGVGRNDLGELGIGNYTNQSSFAQASLPAGKTISKIDCGEHHTVMLMTDGTIYGTGLNNYYQLGLGDTTTRNVFTLVTNMPAGKIPSALVCGKNHTIVLMNDNTMYGTGLNNYSQLGFVGTASTLTLIPNSTGKTISKICGSEDFSIVMMSDGTIYGTGRNYYGQLGTNNTTNYTSLTLMPNSTGKTPSNIFTTLVNTYVLMTDGTIYGAGWNGEGQLGTGDTTQRNLLTQMILPVGKTASNIVTGAFAVYVEMTDGTIYAAGNNSGGRLGVGDTNIVVKSLKQSVFEKSDSIITNFSIASKNFGDASFNIINPSSNSSGSFSYSSSNTSVATVSGNTITIVGFGSTTITATQAETTTIGSGSISTTFTVNKTSATGLKALGYTATQLKIAGYTATEIKTGGYTASEMKAANYTATQMKTAGYTATELKSGSYTATEMKASTYTTAEIKAGGYTATEMKEATYTISELKAVGYTAGEVLVAGYLASDVISNGYTAAELKTGGFTVSDFKIYGFTDSVILGLGFSATNLRNAQYTATQLKPYNYTTSDLRTAGYSITNMVSAGYLKTDIASAGFTITELRNSSFSASDLRLCGFTPAQLSSAGFNASSILTAGYSASQLSSAGYTISQLKTNNYTDASILAGGFTSTQLYLENYSAAQLKANGYTAAQLKSGGYLATDVFPLNYTVNELNLAGYTASELKSASYSAEQLISGGYSKSSVINLGYSISDLKTAGFTASELRVENYSISQLKSGGYTDNEILAGGFTASALKNASPSYTASQLQANNYTIQNLKDASYTANEIISAGYSVSTLKTNGYTSQQLKNNGFNVSQLKDGNYLTSEILSIGYSANELKNNNYSVTDLKTYYTALSVKEGGYLDADILSAGFPADQLKLASYSASQLRTNGYNISQLKTAGYSDQNILLAGFSATELKNASYTASQLKQYNYTVNDLRTANYSMVDIISINYPAADLLSYYTPFQLKTYYTPLQLKQGGYSDNDILSASFSSTLLRSANFTASQLRENNYTISDLVDGQYTTSQILAAGYSSTQLKDAGYSATQLRQNNYTITNLIDANYTNNDILAAGYTATELKSANFTAAQLYSNNYTALQLKNASYDDADILNLGYSIQQIKTAGYQPVDLINIYSDEAILSAGFSASSLKDANYTVSDLKTAGYTVTQIKAALYTDADILSNGFQALQLKQNNYSATQLKEYNYTAAELKEAGYLVSDLQDANYSTEEILSLDYFASQLKAAGYSSSQLKTYFYTAYELKLGGYTDEEILTIGYSVNELTIAGYSVDQMRLNGYTDSSILAGISTVLDTLPSPPVITNVTTSNLKAYVYFTDLSNNEIPVIGYRYTLNNGDDLKWFKNNTSPLEIIGLTNGVSYNIGIYAVNRNGTSTISNVFENVIPSHVPDKPFILNGQSSNGILSFEFIPGNDNGSSITEYYYSINDVNYVLTEPSGNNIIISGLTVNQMYDVMLKSKNAIGFSQKSNIIRIENIGTLISPVITDISSNEGMANVYYTIDSSLNDIYYKYSLNNSNYYYFKNRENPLLLNSLSLNDTYNIKIKAEHYIYGESSDSNTVSFTTISKPSKSIILSANYSNNVITMDIIEGANNGSPIQYYYYSLNDSSYSIVDNIVDSSITIRKFVDIDVSNNIKIKSSNSIGMSEESNTYLMTYELLPEPPTIDYVIPEDKKCSIYFTNGNFYNSPLVCYKYKLSNETESHIARNVDNPLIITDLSNNFDYTVRIKTVTESGLSAYSNLSETFKPFGPPLALTITSIDPRSKSLLVYFTDSDNGGSEILGYKYSLNNGPLLDASSNTSPITIGNLENKTNYSVNLYSYNKSGLSPKSNTILSVPGVPNAPTINSVTGVDSTFTINYTPSTITNGSPVTQMYYTFDDVKFNIFSSIQNPLIIKGITNGRAYDIKIASMNINGFSPLSNKVTAMVSIPPGRPKITNIVLFYESLTSSYAVVTLDTPVTNGSPITKYSYALGNSINYTDISGNTSPLIIPNLPVNVSFTIKLKASNSVGTSFESLPTKSQIFVLNVPSRPVIRTVSTSLNTMTVNFVAPAANGRPITTYKYSLNDSPYVDISSNVVPLSIPIQNNTTYSVKIIAVNLVGDSLPSAAFSKLVSFTYLPPAAPRITSVVGANQSLIVYFSPSIIRGAPVTSYSYSIDGSSNLIDTNSTVSPFTITGLTNGINYPVTLYANSLAGMSAPSSSIIRAPILAEPGMPSVTTVTPLNNACSIDLASPVENGSPIIKYLYTLDGGATLIDTGRSASPLLITGLVNDVSYNIQFIAVNSIGNSPLSLARTITPKYAAPGAPIISRVSTGIGNMTVTFTASTPNGSAIKAYYYSLDNGQTLVNINKLTSPFTISNLTSFLTYTVTLYGENDLGYSPASNGITATVK
jgi:alpha-tubulin suppressor-like RCC1 family protein/uncharacterized protein YjbI with pentapeptide repeats